MSEERAASYASVGPVVTQYDLDVEGCAESEGALPACGRFGGCLALAGTSAATGGQEKRERRGWYGQPGMDASHELPLRKLMHVAARHVC